MALMSVSVAAQDESRAFAGALFGVSALSADAQAVTAGADAAVSLYDPKNGSALNVFGGIHVAQYFAIQVNWMWNRNDLTLVSSYTSPQAGGFYEQTPRQFANMRSSSMASSTSDGWTARFGHTWEQACRCVHFSSDEVVGSLAQGLSPRRGRDRIDSHRSAFPRRDRRQAVAPYRLQVQLQRNNQRQPD